MRYRLGTLGCKANTYDSQLLESALRARGWLPVREGHSPESGPGGSSEGQDVQLCIVNSCTVTDEAESQSRKLLSRWARENPRAVTVLTGCSAEVAPERLLKEVPGLRYVVGNQDKHRLVELLEEAVGAAGTQGKPELLGSARGYGELRSRHPEEREWPLPEASFFGPEALGDSLSSRTRAFLKIQEGCNSFCTYCIIPYGRGPSRSLAAPDLLTQIRGLVREGVQEVVLTGTNLGDYRDSGGDHVALCRRILEETELPRLRISSLSPVEITPELLELAALNPRFCSHFHVSLQSASTRVLRLMKRGYGQEEVRRCLKAVSELPAPLGGVFVGMDVIVGFPGEGEAEFQETVECLRSLPWSRLHVFPYSEREGTPATRLPDTVRKEVRAERARVLRELSLERLEGVAQRALAESRARNQPLQDVLLERAPRDEREKRRVPGTTSNYLRVLLPAKHPGAPGSGSPVAPADELRGLRVSAWPRGVAVDRAAGDAALICEWAD